MLVWTVGTGGDYANWNAAYTALFAAAPLAANYTFIQLKHILSVAMKHRTDAF